MAIPSLFEDCQAWIEKGHESWKSYFSKWENIAKYEDTVTESELVPKLNDKFRKRIQKSKNNGNPKMLKLPLSQKRLRRVFFKYQQNKQRKLIKNKKSFQKIKPEIRNQMLNASPGNENLLEVIENKQLEITLTTVFSDFLKANTNMCEMFDVLFQTYSGRETTIKDSDYLFPKQQVLPNDDLETNAASVSFENQQGLSSSPVPKLSLNNRSICPPRNVYLQSLNENMNEIHSKQIGSKWGLQGSPRIGAQVAQSFGTYNLSKQQFITSNGSQTPLLGQNLEVRSCPPLRPTISRFKNTGLKSVQLDSSHKFLSSSSQSKEYLIKTISKMNITQEGKRLLDLCLQQRTNSLSLSMDNINFITPQRKLSEQKSKMLSQRRHSWKKLIFDSKEDDDSDSDDQTKYHSPIIRCQNKRLKADELAVDAVEPDADECQFIFDRIVKS